MMVVHFFFFQVTKYKRNFELCSIRTRIHIINFDIDKCTVRILLFGLPKVYIYYLFPMFDEIQSKLCSIGIRIQFKYLLLDKRVISTIYLYPRQNSKKTRIKIYPRTISLANFRSVIQAFTSARAWKEQSAGSPFFRGEAGSRCVRLLCLDSGLASVGSRWKPLLKRSRRRWKSGIENWFQAGTELGGVARSGVADARWWGAIRFAAVVGEGWQRQVMVYSYSQSGSGVRWGEIASCRA